MTSQLINFYTMNNKLTFQDLLDPIKFLELQNTFKHYDERDGMPEHYFKKPTKEDFSVVYGGLNPETGENLLNEEFFYKDYLFRGLNDIDKSYINGVEKNFNRLKIEQGNTELYYKQIKEEIILFFNLVDECYYLPDIILNLLKNQLNNCLEKIQEIKNTDNIYLGDKLNFKIMRQDVLVLFYLLREKGHIKWHSNPELKFILENNFMSFDKKTKEYLNIKVRKNVFTDFKNGNRPINKSVERLKSIFQDDDFFDIT